MDWTTLFTNYREVAEYVDDMGTKSLLSIFERQIADREFLLPFIGQYSAGKSKLINHILGRDILPTRRTETTAFPTYIQYGEEDMAILIYSDQSTKEISFTNVKELDYQMVKDMDKSITCLRIYVKHPILSTGLIMVDTPGVNTLVNEHVKMTEELLANSMYVMYVFRGALTRQDIMMIEKIESLNIHCVFVRTHADLIHDEEEDMATTLLNEGQMLNSKMGKEVPFFAVTNEDDCKYRDVLDMNFGFLTDYLQNDIAANIDDNYKKAITQRLEGIREKLEKVIDSKISLIEATNDASEKDLEKNERNIKVSKERLRHLLTSNEQRIKSNEDNVLSGIQEHLNSKYELGVRSFKSAVGKCYFKTTEEATFEYQRLLSDHIMMMAAEISKDINDYAEDNVGVMNEDIANFSSSIERESGIALNINFDMNAVAEVEQKQKLLEQDFNEKYVQLKQLHEMSNEKLSKLGIERSELDNTISQFDATIEECQKVQNEVMSSYSPHYVDVQGSCAKFFKYVGTACDMGMLLIPASGFAKGACMTAKAASNLSNGNKLLQLGGSAMNQLSKGLNVIAKTDRIKDTATLLKSAIEVVHGTGAKRELKKKKSFLDYLSLSYWFEKAGELIDSPAKVLDQQYESEFNNKIKEIRSVAQNKVQERLLLLQRRGYIKNQKDALLKRQEILKEEEINLEQRYKRERQNLDRKMLERTQEVFRENMCKQFELKAGEFKKLLFKKSREIIEQMRYNLLDAANHVTYEKLEAIENELSELKVKKQKGMDNQMEDLQQLISMKGKLILDK